MFRSNRRPRQKDRLIFTFWDGQRDRKADPLAVHRSIAAREGFDLELEMKLAASSTPEAPAALGRVLTAARDAFGVKPLEEGGLTDGETLQLLFAFASWVESVRKKLKV